MYSSVIDLIILSPSREKKMTKLQEFDLEWIDYLIEKLIEETPLYQMEDK